MMVTIRRKVKDNVCNKNSPIVNYMKGEGRTESRVCRFRVFVKILDNIKRNPFALDCKGEGICHPKFY